MKHAQPLIRLDGYSVNLNKAVSISRGAPVRISSSARRKVDQGRRIVQQYAQGNDPVYGVNTGFGYLSNQQIPKKDLLKLQSNIMKSHAAGTGQPLSIPETRLAMALRLNLLIKGFSGARYELCELLERLIRAEIYPIVPEYGSVGASGDLIPLAHMGLPLIGEGKVSYHGRVITARKALKQARLKPIVLAEKEGLSFVNGTEIMQAVGGLALANAIGLANAADKITALSYEAMEARLSPLEPVLHRVRGHRGQIQTARNIWKELEGSYLHGLRRKKGRPQGPYSIRCAPQIHGPSREALEYSRQVLETEMNAVTDNPLVFSDTGRILSGGNFHGQAIAMAFDFAAIACSELANVSERRLELLLNPNSSDLPAFLTPKPGTNSGYMTFQYLSASVVNENKILANPACTDSIPGNAGFEDHVSMGMTSARKLRKVAENTRTALACELLAACQAIDLRKIKRLGRGTRLTYKRLRERVPTLGDDRILAGEVEEARKLVAEF